MSKGLAGVPTPSAQELAKKWKLPLATIAKKIAAGAKVEREHTTSAKQAAEIARDHINERPDYYDKVKKMEKSPIVKEESTSGVAGLGYNTGTPAIDPSNEYTNTNAMSYIDWNGNILKMIKDKHDQHLKDMGFSSYSPNEIQTASNKVMKEATLNELGEYDNKGGSPVIGDLSGSSRKAVKEEKPCWKGYEAIGMKKKNGKSVPNCVPVKEQGYGIVAKTERPIYERGKTPADMTGAAERGIYEGHIGFGHPYDWAGDRVKRKVYGTKPKEKPESNEPGTEDTYKGSKQGGKVKFAKTVKEEQMHEDLGSAAAIGGALLGTGVGTYLGNKLVSKIANMKKKNVKKLVKEATYQGKTVPLNKPMKGDVKKSKVYVDPDGDGKAQKVNFGDKKLSIKKDQPNRKKSYCARSSGQGNLTDKTSANYWSRKAWDCEEETQINELAADVAPMQHMDAAKSGEYRPARASQSRVNLRGSTAHVKGASYQSGTGQARASFSSGAGQMKPTTTNVPFRGMRSVSNAKTTQGVGGQLKPTSTSGSSSFTPNSQSRSMNVGKAMGASKQTSPVVKGMSAAGQEASKKIVPKAASVMATVGKAARALSGPEGAVAAAAAEPLAKKMASSFKAGHQSMTPHGDEGEKASTVFARMKQPTQGRSVSQYEKDVLTPKASAAPKAPENPKVDAPTPPSRPDYFTKGQAFGAARKEAGGGEGKFSYQSGSDSAPKEYQTNVKSEPYKPSAQLKQTSIKEETKMDKNLINEALQNILEDNLSEMKENLTQALQEKAIEKLEERKKEIAASYFAQ